jgi:hypothetical protein
MARKHAPSPLSFLTTLLLLTPYVFADWTVLLNPAQASSYGQCISAHSGDMGACWVYWTDTTVTLPPSTVFTDVFVTVTATLLPPMSEETESSGLSVPSTATPVSKSTWMAPVQTSSPSASVQTSSYSAPIQPSSPSAKAKSSSASRPEASRPLLFMVVTFLVLVHAHRLVAA